MAIYDCMSTKAVHLELVNNLNTEAFVASLKRLLSRRGKSIEIYSEVIYSDNATNFVSARRESNKILIMSRRVLKFSKAFGKIKIR